MPISLGFWEWGCPKRVDAHITVTAPQGPSRRVPWELVGTSKTVVDFRIHAVDFGLQVN